MQADTDRRLDTAVDKLRAGLKGRVIVPGDLDYDAARTVFPGGFDRRPALIVRIADTADVSRVIAFARDNGLELAVRGGGHSSAGFGVTEGGVVIDMTELRALEIDAGRRTAWAAGGLTAGAYTAAAAEHGLATGFGDTGSVGLGGLTLGGGIGYLTRKHGLTIDSLLAAEIVTADGRVRHVDADSEPDLFWAIRGGGGNFGVATRFQFRLHDLATIVGGMLMLPATAETIAAFVAEADAAPDELSTIAAIMAAPPMPFVPPEHVGKLVILAMLAFAGPPDAGEKVVARFRGIAKPVVDMVRPMRYPELFQPGDPTMHPVAVARCMFADKLDRADAETILEFLRRSPAPMSVVQFRVLGGAVARVPVDATAFAHRASRIMLAASAVGGPPDEAAARTRWLAEFAAALGLADSGAYVGFMGDEGPERVRAAYPRATWDRLAAIKARFDPTNLFRLNQNVPPSGNTAA